MTGINAGANAIVNNTPVLADDVRSGASTSVTIGSMVKAIWVELWILGTGQQPSIFQVTLEKVQDTTLNMSHADALGLHNYNNKNNVFYTTQGLVGDANTNPIPALRQWIAIPKGKQRMNQDSAFKLNVANLTATDDFEFCGTCIYKETVS